MSCRTPSQSMMRRLSPSAMGAKFKNSPYTKPTLPTGTNRLEGLPSSRFEKVKLATDRQCDRHCRDCRHPATVAAGTRLHSRAPASGLTTSP